MPNWCNNDLYISHADTKMMRRFVKAWNRSRVLDEFIPVPPELKDSAMTMQKIVARRGKTYNDNYEKELNQLTKELNLKYFGYEDWYNFCVSEWGTKWDVGLGDYGSILTADDARKGHAWVSFDSAWSPPITAYEKLKDMGFEIRAYYYESGMAYCGSWIDGDDQYYSIEGNSEWVKENIPSDIDSAFAISESMAEWEEENAEETS